MAARALTKELAALAGEIHGLDADDNPITRRQALADLIWKFALGWEEVSRDDVGNVTRVQHKPAPWAMQYIFERIEGRAAVAVMGNEGSKKASEKVRELATDRINAMSASAAGPPKRGKQGA